VEEEERNGMEELEWECVVGDDGMAGRKERKKWAP
jgi:hypothetical protein